MQVIFTFISAALLQASADAALQPWASKAQAGDVANRHVEEISLAEHTYTVVHGGTVDGECCRTPMGCGINREGVIDQSWQSNRAVRMENVGQTDLINPWLSNGRPGIGPRPRPDQAGPHLRHHAGRHTPPR